LIDILKKIVYKNGNLIILQIQRH